MQLLEALKIIRDRSRAIGDVEESSRTFDLLCGFTPLHLRTLLTAALTQRIDDVVVSVEIGLYGDLLGNVERAVEHADAQTSRAGVAILAEWSDLDPRLGLRTTHGWRPDRASDILASVGTRLNQLATAIPKLAERTSVAVCLPTLPLPPMFVAPTSICTTFVSRLRSLLYDFAATLADADVRVLDEQALNFASPISERLDVASDLRSGFPYQMNHAWTLADQLAEVIRPEPMLKGIISDLDNTLWAGIVGEDGVDAVSWDLDHKTQHHGLYQEQLASLAASGTLLAIASKNEAAVVEQALNRDDLVISQDQVFPIEANWGAKSESISRILQAWNVGPDAVMFIDDSPIELAEVAAAFPSIHRRAFPTSDEAGVLALLTELRDKFGRVAITEEDRLRLQSLKASAELTQPHVDPEEFLANAEAELSLSWNQPDARALELINKTNQFNLNGQRIDESEWHRRLAQPNSFLLSVSYKDKFAPLGKIAVVLGQLVDGEAQISAWVMSCRAFSRRIEFGTLSAILDRFKCQSIGFDFRPNQRNAPLQKTLEQLASDESKSLDLAVSDAPFRVSRTEVVQRIPQTYFKVSTDDNQRNSIPA